MQYWTSVVMMSFWNLKLSTKDIPSAKNMREQKWGKRETRIRN